MNEIITVIQDFANQMTTEYNVREIIVYDSLNKIYGSPLNSLMLERYLSLSRTTIFKDNERSSMVSHIKTDEKLYIIVLASNSPEAFDGIESQYIINQILILKRKLGEVRWI